MTQRHDTDAELEAALRRSRVLEDAPEHLIQKALDLWQPRTAGRAAPGGGLRRRLAALLSFDSAGLTPQAAGLRSAGDDTRQMLFSAEGRDVDLRIGPMSGAGWQVGGQILGPDETGTVELSCGDFHAETPWNELSEFRFDAVPAGTCRLTLRSADWELELPGLQIPG
jgi:hypothetical protein